MLFGEPKPRTRPRKICAKENVLEKYREIGKLKQHPPTLSAAGQWRSSWKKNLPYKKDTLFTQMFQNILPQAPPRGSEHNNCCNYSNQIR